MMIPWIYAYNYLPDAKGQEAVLTLVSVIDGNSEYTTAAFYYPKLKSWLDDQTPMNVYAWSYMPKPARR